MAVILGCSGGTDPETEEGVLKENLVTGGVQSLGNTGLGVSGKDNTLHVYTKYMYKRKPSTYTTKPFQKTIFQVRQVYQTMIAIQ